MPSEVLECFRDSYKSRMERPICPWSISCENLRPGKITVPKMNREIEDMKNSG